jgi:hypothetical protein
METKKFLKNLKNFKNNLPDQELWVIKTVFILFSREVWEQNL